MTRHTGAEITVRLLERQNVATIAGIPGGAVLPLYDALARSRTIRHVLARHEQGAGFIAQFNDHVGWRTDARYFRAVVDNQEDNEFDASFGSFDFWRATAGLTFTF